MGLHRYLDTEKALIEQCRQGSGAAQRQLYERHAGRLFAVCCRYLKDRMEAEDVLVTGFNKIFGRLHQYRGEGSLEGWMRRIMVNEALNCLRRSKQLHLTVGLEAAMVAGSHQPASDPLEAGELLQMVANLPTGYRTVFNLYAIEGYTHQEIGALLGISENTSKSQLSRARASLMKQLESTGKGNKKKVTTNQTA